MSSLNQSFAALLARLTRDCRRSLAAATGLLILAISADRPRASITPINRPVVRSGQRDGRGIPVLRRHLVPRLASLRHRFPRRPPLRPLALQRDDGAVVPVLELHHAFFKRFFEPGSQQSIGRRKEMARSRTLWTAGIAAALGVFLQAGTAGAQCIIPLARIAAPADSDDVMYIVRGADGIYRFTIEDVNRNGVFGFTTSSLPGNPFAAATDLNGNGFANTLGTSAGYTNVAPYTTFPSEPSGASEPVCSSFCKTRIGCAVEIVFRGNDGSFYRTAFRGAATVPYASFHRSLAIFDDTKIFPQQDAPGTEDGFPGRHGADVPWVRITS